MAPTPIFKGGHEGHEDRITERALNLKENVFFLRALRVLRGEHRFSFGCGPTALCLCGDIDLFTLSFGPQALDSIF
jgi:hypothetical protein